MQISSGPGPAVDLTARTAQEIRLLPRRGLALPRSVRWSFGLATVALFVLTLTPLDTIGRAAEAPPQHAEASIDALLPSWRERVEWGLDRFAAAGLPLPPMEVTVHRHTRPCDGNSGLFQPGPPVEVHVCSVGDADTNAARLIVLHELAHAWAETYLEPAQREQFLELRGLESWIDPARPSHEWGAEHAAEVVSWGLMETQVELIRIPNVEPSALREAFQLLVGREPLVTDGGAAHARTT
jgi:hypothetical protein